MLKLAVYIRQPLFEPAVVLDLVGVLAEALPEFSKAGLAQDEDDEPVWISGSNVEHALSAAGVRNGSGETVLLPGRASETAVYLLGSRRTDVDPRANAILIDFEVNDRSDAVALAVFRRLVGLFRCNYGRLGSEEEFNASNMHTGPDGTYAIGVQLRSGLPGLYWANYLGPSIVRSIAYDFIAGGWEPVNNGVLRVLYKESKDWAGEAAHLAREEELDAWGRAWVFDRTSANRMLRAPTLW